MDEQHFVKTIKPVNVEQNDQESNRLYALQHMNHHLTSELLKQLNKTY